MRLSQYVDAIERAFGAEVDYGSIIKTFSHSDVMEQRRYSPPEVIDVKRIPMMGASCRSDFHQLRRETESYDAHALPSPE